MHNLKEIEKQFPKGTNVQIKIEEVKGYGVNVCFLHTPSIKGFIPKTEVDWTRKPRDLSEQIKANDIKQACIIDYDEISNHVILSFKKVLENPFEKYKDIIKRDNIIYGEVVSIFEHGANIEIEACVQKKDEEIINLSVDGGVIGFVSLENIIFKKPRHIEEVLLVGDKVKALVVSVEETEHSFHLSIRQLLINEKIELLKQDESPLKHLKLPEEEHTYLEKEDDETDKILLSVEAQNRIKKVLLIDDKTALCASIEEIFVKRGMEFTFVTKNKNKDNEDNIAKQGLHAYNVVQPDLVLIDFNLEEIHGIDIAKQIRAINENVFILFITAYTDIKLYSEELQKLNLHHNVLIKPFTENYLVSTINDLVSGEIAKNNIEEIEGLSSELQVKFEDDNFKSLPLLHEKKPRSLLLSHVQQETGADASIIVKMHITTLEVELFEFNGIEPSRFEEHKYRLRYSPIRDIIQDREDIIANNIPSNARRYHHLMGVFPEGFHGFIGIPISYTDMYGYGIFLFKISEGKRNDPFTEEDKKKAVGTSIQLSSLIQQERIEEVMKEQQKFLLLGQLSSGLVHEINNEIQSLILDCKTLADDSKEIQVNRMQFTDDAFNKRFHRITARMYKTQKNLSEINMMFLNQIKKERFEKINLMSHIQDMIISLKPFSLKNHVMLHVRELGKMPHIELNTAYLDQILTNVLLNGIEVIPCIRAKGGRIDIELCHDDFEDLPIKIRVQDNGPGIHRVNYEKIFSLLYTTKENGAGLGLYIARSLAQLLGGRIRVESSTLYLGTTFLIELP